MIHKNEEALGFGCSALEGMSGTFDAVLNTVIGRMEEKDADEAVVTLKLAVRLQSETEYDARSGRSVLVKKPAFEYSVGSQITMKDAYKGERFDPDTRLAWDNQLLAYKLVTKRDQMTIEDLEVSEE